MYLALLSKYIIESKNIPSNKLLLLLHTNHSTVKYFSPLEIGVKTEGQLPMCVCVWGGVLRAPFYHIIIFYHKVMHKLEKGVAKIKK